MNDETRYDRSLLSLEILNRIDRICDRLRTEWESGGRPSIEGYLHGIDEAYRSALLGDLLEVELDARRRRGELPQLSEYLERFPIDAATVVQAFAVKPVRDASDSVPMAGIETLDSEDFHGSDGESTRPAESDVDPGGSFTVRGEIGDSQRFRVLRPHAKGGLGAVFVALDLELHREVALKQILEGQADNPVSRCRFLLEAEITGGLEHPGIVPVYGLGTYANGQPYYAMRFIRGESLKGAIDRFHAGPFGSRDLELRKLLRRFLDVCNAIDYAHTRGVLHRDLKPNNIIVGNHGETLVVDWGLAKALGRTDAEVGPQPEERPLVPFLSNGSAETIPGSALGTPAYMSPEQARGDLERLGPASDVYSLGATLYCLLTGKPPFEGDDARVLLRGVELGDFPHPRRLDPAIDRALEAVCLKTMAREPEDRYATPRALADDLECWMADEPVTAWREPLARRARRWTRRNRSLMMAACGMTLMALIGLAAVLVVQSRANVWLRHANLELAIANSKVTRANAELEAANERERQRFDLATEAIQRYHTDVSEDFLLKQDQFKDLRDRLLRDAVLFYRKLEDLLSAQADARSRQALGRAYEEVGDLTGKIGSLPEALEAHRKALEVRRALALEAASDAHTKVGVGRSLIAVGILLTRMGRYDEALKSFQEARSELESIVDPGAAQDAILGEIARSFYWMGHTYYAAGRNFEAKVSFERAGAIGEELTASHRGSVEDERLLSWGYNDIGNLLVLEGKGPQGLTAYEASRRIKQKIADDHPDVAEYHRDLANAHSNIGIVMMEAGKLAAALGAQSAAVEIVQKLADAYPALGQLRLELSNCLNEKGDILRLIGRNPEARACYEQALAILDGLLKTNPSLTKARSWLLQGQRGLGATQLAAGQTPKAVATWRRAIEAGELLHSSPAETLYYLAGCHALLGGVAGTAASGLSATEGQAELERAMDTLHQTIAAGYRPVDWMKRDPDLAPLRSRPDFQLLLMDLSFPAQPFVP
jgi:serine/threonine-protein kinase